MYIYERTLSLRNDLSRDNISRLIILQIATCASRLHQFP